MGAGVRRGHRVETLFLKRARVGRRPDPESAPLEPDSRLGSDPRLGITPPLPRPGFDARPAQPRPAPPRLAPPRRPENDTSSESRDSYFRRRPIFFCDSSFHPSSSRRCGTMTYRYSAIISPGHRCKVAGTRRKSCTHLGRKTSDIARSRQRDPRPLSLDTRAPRDGAQAL